MIRDKYNIIPAFMAAVLHAAFVLSLVVVVDFSTPVTAAMPLAIEATLVSADELKVVPPPVVDEPEPEPEPELEPEPEPEPEPEVDDSEQERLEAEEQMRLEELAREQQRIRLEKEADQKKRAKEAEERKQRAEAELERKRVAAEKRRLEDIERQRRENERLRKLAIEKEAEELRLREISEEEARLLAMNSGAMARYQFALQQKIMRNWAEPASAKPGIECVVDILQLPGGDVVSARVGRCNGDEAVRRSIVAAVLKASPLPEPENSSLFQRELRFIFKPEE